LHHDILDFITAQNAIEIPKKSLRKSSLSEFGPQTDTVTTSTTEAELLALSQDDHRIEI
jgi:hypothetical protein